MPWPKGMKWTEEHRKKVLLSRPLLLGKDSAAYKHGMKGTPTYRSWNSMKSRVHYREDDTYRDVDMDPRWEDFQTFWADMGTRPDGMTIDRIDNARGYWPDNCRWATKEQQRQNQDRSRGYKRVNV